MTPSKLNFAVIGCGSLAQMQHLPNIAGSSKAALHTCCDVSESALAVCRSRFHPRKTTTDYQKAIRDPEVEAICIATTESLRLPVIAAAAKAGKPVYCEKPMAASIQEACRIREIVKSEGIPFLIGHNRRCAPALADAHQIFRRHMTAPGPCRWRWRREGDRMPALPEDGVAAMNVRINDDWYSWKRWGLRSTDTLGPLLFEFTHFFDICNWFLAAEPVTIVAVNTGLLLHSVIVRYRTGEIATITCCANGTFGYGKELYEAMGNGGYVAVDHLLEVRTAGVADAPPKIVYNMLKDRHPDVGRQGGMSGWLEKKLAACKEAADQGDPLLQFTAEPDKGHARALDAFVDQIRGLREPICSVDDALLSTRMSLAAVLSAEAHRTVHLDEIGGDWLEARVGRPACGGLGEQAPSGRDNATVAQ